MSRTITIMKRELGAYFATPVAYVFIVIFLLLTGVFTFISAASTSVTRPISNRFFASIRGCICC